MHASGRRSGQKDALGSSASEGMEKERKLYARKDTDPRGGRISISRHGKTAPRAAWLLAALALAGWAGASGASAEPLEHWYRIELSGQTAGWAMESQEPRGDEIVSVSKMRLEIRRGASVAAIEMESRFVESRDGSPRRAWARQKLGALPVESSYEFGDDFVMVRHAQPGGSASEGRSEKLPLPEGDWLTPAQAELRLHRELDRGAREFSIRALDPLLGLEPVTTHWVLEAKDDEVLTERGAMRAERWRQTQSYAPQVSTLAWVDADALMVRSETTLMGLGMTLVLGEREAVLRQDAEAPELLVRSFVRPDRAIERPRSARRAVYELRTGGGELPEVPSVGAQRAEREGSTARITVEVGSSPEVEEAGGEYRAATTYLPHDDPRIRELVHRALDGDRKRSDAERAEALRAFVHGYLVKKDLNTVLATAAEVAATRSGDCTEHSVLLAALLRAAGIPSRVVSGLIYVERFAGATEIFAYHMWTEALVDRRWIDLDATLDAAPFDAAHIALATSALGDGDSALQEMARVLPWMGRIEIRVLEVGPR